MKKIIPITIALVVVGGGAFYGGMIYGQNRSPLSNFSRQNLQNLTPEQRQQLFQGNIGGGSGGSGRGSGSGFLNGEVLDKDEKSLTLKMSDSGSKIVFFSSSTQISKTTDGAINDIEVGKQITVSGNQNSDGSYTAKMIQLKPSAQK
ncbi:MAG: DUF5666 domain-containing protein [bacterium]|nr:DUF5666 domain-containing protein [bacterium]